MGLEGFKWDAQVGDVGTLAPFALVLPTRAWEQLARLAEALARELKSAENELIHRPDLWPALGLPQRLSCALAGSDPWTPAATRVIRFDFHPTTDGWRISEANSDVPGGYTEASRYTQLMADALADAKPADDPTARLCAVLAQAAGEHGRIALLAAPGYTEDQQVVAHLADALRAHGIAGCPARPEQLNWRAGLAYLGHLGKARPVDAVFRFYQGEWMTRLPDESWRSLFRGGLTPVCNPASALLVESKRLPLVWSELETAVPHWRQFLPRTCAAAQALFHPGRPWVLKQAYGNTGDAVISRGWSRRRDYALALTHSTLAPRQWTAQDAFSSLALETPLGAAHVCIGVYVIDGSAAGLYGRLSKHRLIDYQAIDTAVLID